MQNEITNLQTSLRSDPFNIGQGEKHGHGFYYDEGASKWYRPETFSYSATWENITGVSYQSQRVIQIQADAAFIAREQVAIFYDVSAPTVQDSARLLPVGLRCLINDTGSSKNLSNRALAINNDFGTAERPYILPMPKYYAAASSISLDVSSSLDFGADTYVLELVLKGEKRYYYDGDPRAGL